MTEFDVIVVGAGMMGGAAARHIAGMGRRVALVGPGEPDSKHDHKGVFASHYDAARITRALDADETWAKLSRASIDRYAEIEQAGGRAFFHEVGSLMAAPPGARNDFIGRVQSVGERQRVRFDRLRDDALRDRFACFSFPKAVIGLHERAGAGYVDPRELVSAQKTAAMAAGAALIETEATGLHEKRDAVIVSCADGRSVRGGQVIVAGGAFTIAGGILPDPLPLRVCARTVLFCELDESEYERLRGMPSLIYEPDDEAEGVYVLPPVRYPDGRTYLKIGGDPRDRVLQTVDEIKAWFRTDGDPEVGNHLREQLSRFMPDLRCRALSTGSCVTAFTQSGNPLIRRQSDRLIVLAGGNGAGAKCSDEIGRLGAMVAIGQSIAAEGYGVDFGSD